MYTATATITNYPSIYNLEAEGMTLKELQDDMTRISNRLGLHPDWTITGHQDDGYPYELAIALAVLLGLTLFGLYLMSLKYGVPMSSILTIRNVTP